MIFIVFVEALFASAITANKILLSTLSPLFLVFMRMFFGGLILFGIAIWVSPRFRPTYIKKDFLHLATIALLTTFIPSLLKAYGLQNMLSSKSTFIGSLDPFATALYSYLLWNEKLNTRKLMGMFLAFSGALVLCFSHTSTEKMFENFFIFSFPELAALAAVFIGRYGWILAQIALKKDRYSPVELNALIMIISSGWSLISLLTSQASIMRPSSTTPAALGALLFYTIIVGNVIGYSLYGMMLKKYSANFVSLCGFLIPVCVTLFGYLLLNEPISTTLLVAISIILIGVYLFFKEEIKVA